jgi:hypothetical protein
MNEVFVVFGNHKWMGHTHKIVEAPDTEKAMELASSDLGIFKNTFKSVLALSLEEVEILLNDMNTVKGHLPAHHIFCR